MEDLSLHILDIAENAIRAKANKVAIEIFEDEDKDLLTICIKDNGEGMDEATVKKALDPFFSTKDGKRIGLGLALFSQAAQQTGGHLEIDSRIGSGTMVTATFRPKHPDMKPMGDISQTVLALLAGNSSVRLVLDYTKDGKNLHFDSQE